MAAIVIRDNAKATWLTGLADVRAKACNMIQRAMACAAATILICAVAAALFQLAAELLSFPAPIAVTAMTLMAAALSWPGSCAICSGSPTSAGTYPPPESYSSPPSRWQLTPRDRPMLLTLPPALPGCSATSGHSTHRGRCQTHNDPERK